MTSTFTEVLEVAERAVNFKLTPVAGKLKWPPLAKGGTTWLKAVELEELALSTRMDAPPRFPVIPTTYVVPGTVVKVLLFDAAVRVAAAI